MTNDLPHVERYLVRKGIHEWMLWDRKTHGPAKVGGRVMTGLTEEHARKVKAELTKPYIAEG